MKYLNDFIIEDTKEYTPGKHAHRTCGYLNESDDFNCGVTNDEDEKWLDELFNDDKIKYKEKFKDLKSPDAETREIFDVIESSNPKIEVGPPTIDKSKINTKYKFLL